MQMKMIFINILHVIELIIIALLLLVSTTTSASSTLKNDDVYIPKRTLIPTVHDHSHSHDDTIQNQQPQQNGKCQQ